MLYQRVVTAVASYARPTCLQLRAYNRNCIAPTRYGGMLSGGPGRVLQCGLSRGMATMQERFDVAKDTLGTLKEDPGNAVKLNLYALFKQATTGKVSTKRPGMVDFVGRAKWDAWSALGDLTPEQAQQQYVDVVEELVVAEGGAAPEAASAGTEENKYTTILVTVEGGLRTITLNRPHKKNAIIKDMYEEWSAALEEGAKDPATIIVAVTGAGDYYCAGNDLSMFSNIPEGGPAKHAKDMGDFLYKFIDSFIQFPKPLVAVVNGPAVGVSVTILGLFDAVYATDKATFNTPFSALGQSAEGCSSFMFPRMMGPGLATEMLLFNKKLTAVEAQQARLVTQVYPDSRLHEEVWPRLRELATLPRDCLIYGKQLQRDHYREDLMKTNRAECDRLVERWQSDECMQAIMKFFARKK